MKFIVQNIEFTMLANLNNKDGSNKLMLKGSTDEVLQIMMNNGVILDGHICFPINSGKNAIQVSVDELKAVFQ